MGDPSLNRPKKRSNWLTEKIYQFRRHRQEEEDLLNAIDRILSETKTKISKVSGYRKKLKDPIRTALNKITAMTSQIPGPVTLDPDKWEDSPVLRTIFVNPKAFSQWGENCKTLQNALQQNPTNDFYGLMVAEYHEKTSLGVGLVGDIIQKDVLQKSVYFENPQIVVPHTDLEGAQRELKHRILVMLFTQELDEIADLQALTEELERQQEILEVKLWSGKNRGTSGRLDAATVKEAKKIISDIDQEIEKIGRHPDSPESHMAHVVEVLLNIEKHLSMDPFTLRINRLGIKVSAESLEPYDKIDLAQCNYINGHKRAVTWVRINKGFFK